MDLNTLFAIALTSIFLGLFQNTVGHIFDMFVNQLFTVVDIESERVIRELDKYLLKKSKYTSVCIHDSAINPINDKPHIRRIGYGFIIAIRKPNPYRSHNGQQDLSYRIYALGNALRNLQECQIFLDDDFATTTTLPIEPNQPTKTKSESMKKIKISHFESPTPWKYDFITTNEEMFFNLPFPGQEQCIQLIKKSNAKSVLLCGDPGVGKTNVSIFLGKERNAHIVFGYDLTASGVSLDTLWRLDPTEDKPVILVLDEIDGAFACAERNEPSIKYRNLAQNKTAFNSLFDRFERTRNLIILATSNKSMKELEGRYPSYIRKGRFDLCVTLTLNECLL